MHPARIVLPLAIAACGIDAVGSARVPTLAEETESGVPTADAADGGDLAPETSIPFNICPEADGKTIGTHCYFPLLPKRNYGQAKAGCIAAGGHLVTMTSAEEHTLVSSIHGEADRWIGLEGPIGSYDAGSYTWVTGEPVTFMRWENGDPDDGTGCVVQRNVEDWSDRSCGDAEEAICERE